MNAIERRQNYILVRLLFIQKSRDLSDAIANLIDSKADDMLWQMYHDLEWCGDPKMFYEKEIPFRIENETRKFLKQMADVIAQKYAFNLNWLQNQLKRIGFQTFYIPFSNYDVNAPKHLQEKLNLIDIHKTRLCSKLGTLFVALCLSSFGLGAFVGAMLCGTGTEEILLSRSKTSKEKIRQIIPTIMDSYKLQMKTRMLAVVANVDSNIMNELNNMQL